MNSNTRKWVIVATMLIAIICNYLDRQLLSILKPEVLDHFQIDNAFYAWIVNIFLICYAIMYPISGILVDKIGPKKVMLAGIIVWSLACIGGGLAPNKYIFAACRGILGIAEPTVFASQLVAVAVWFEKRQRATANSLCTIGGSLGAVIAPLLIAWLMGMFDSWQDIFIIAGVAGLVIAGMWLVIYKTPPQEVLEKTVYTDMKSADGQTKQKIFTMKGLFKTKGLYGALLIRLISDPVWYFCCFWLPGFLRTMGENEGLSHEQTLNLIQWIGGIPFLVGALGGMLISFWSDNMIKNGMVALRSRKKVLYLSALVAPLCMTIPFISGSDALSFDLQIGLVVGIFSIIAIMCLSWLYTVPVVMTEIFPIENVATVMGICCGSGALGSIFFNWLTGQLGEGDWYILFGIMGVLHLITSVVLWKLVRVEKPENYDPQYSK